jgi:hypothetical protein
MDFELDIRFQRLKEHLAGQFGMDMDEKSMLFLIGVNELGQGYRSFSKSEKTDLFHVAICTLLEPYGYYVFDGKDKDDWPHFTLLKELPPLDHREQQYLLKQAMLEYFIANDYFVDPADSV